jgi:hypothetical protein
MNDKTASTPSTTVPCPPWCTEPDGHGFEQFTPMDDHIRFHFRDVAEVAIAEGPPSGKPAVVTVTAMERAASPEGPADLDALLIEIASYSCEGMTTAEARQIAAALLNAAELVDEITGGA